MTDPRTDLRQKPFDLLRSLASFAQANRIPLTDPQLIQAFASDASDQLAIALDDPTLIHGSRTEQLFEATVISLGAFRLFKSEDTGRVHSRDVLRAPDFRAVLNDGDQWLIEVKNVRCSRPHKQSTTMSAAYLQSLEAYAEAVGVSLRLAIYWSLWNIWTIIDPANFLRKDGSLKINMKDAIVVNEFNKLGEVWISTVAPLRVVLGADPSKPRDLIGDLANFTVGSVQIYASGEKLENARDYSLAEVLLFFGDWTAVGPVPIVEADAISGVEYLFKPDHEGSEGSEGWSGIGWASRIFSRYFSAQTVEDDRVVQLFGEAAPEWFASLTDWDFDNSKLPLRLMRVVPSPELIERGPAR